MLKPVDPAASRQAPPAACVPTSTARKGPSTTIPSALVDRGMVCQGVPCLEENDEQHDQEKQTDQTDADVHDCTSLTSPIYPEKGRLQTV